MVLKELLALAGIKTVRKVSENTTVIELDSGGVRPATEVEKRLVGVLATIVANS